MPQDSPCLKVDGNLLTAVPVGIVRNESRDLGNLLRVDASHRAESPKITFLPEVPGDGHSMVIVECLHDRAIKVRRVVVNLIRPLLGLFPEHLLKVLAQRRKFYLIVHTTYKTCPAKR